MQLKLDSPIAGFTPLTKAFITGLMIGAVYGVLFTAFQGACDGRG
jgi:F0F1-type ATP synthase assembly protein I